MREVSYRFRRFVVDRIERDAMDVINKVTPTVTLEELYDAFGINADDKETLIKAERRSWYRHTTNYRIRLNGFGIIREVPVAIKASLPPNYTHITQGNFFAPILTFTQEWSILQYITSEVMQLITRDAVGGVFPWLPDVIREEDYNYEKGATNRSFFSHNMIKNSDDKKKFHTDMMALRRPPKYIPVVPTVAREAIALGNKLYTQYRLLKDRPNMSEPEDKIKIRLQTSDDYVPQTIKDAVQEMKEFQLNLKQKRIDGELYEYYED